MTAVREVMTEQLVTVEPSTSVAAAVTVMGIQRVGAVLVLENGRLVEVGLFHEDPLGALDVVRHCGSESADGSLDDPKPGHGGPRSIG